MKKNNSIVLGLAGSNPLSTVKSLGYEGIPTIGFHISDKDENRVYVSSSKYLGQGIYVSGQEELLKKLQDYGEIQDRRGVLFPTGDQYVVFCSQNKDFLSKYFYVPKVKGKDIENLLDKNINSKLAEGTGFNTLASGYLSNFSDINDRPYVVKPINSAKAPKSSITFYKSSRDLLADKQKLLDKYEEMVFQEFVPGDNTNIFEVHAFQSSKGMVIGGMQRQRLSLIQGPNVHAGIVYESVWDQSLVEPAKNLLRKLNFNGPVDINLKRSTKDKLFYFIECNLRTSSNLALDTFSGLNLPAIVYFDLIGEDFSYLINRKSKVGVRWVDESDIEVVLNQEKRRGEVLNALNGVKVGVFYDPTDMQPFDNLNLNSTTKKILEHII